MKKYILTITFVFLVQSLLLAQSFTFDTPQLEIHKNPGQLIVFYNYLVNNTASDVNFRVIRTQTLPDTTWSSSICVGDSTTGLCYPTWVDTTLVHVLPASQSLPILLDVFTPPNNPGEAVITLRVENADNPSEYAEATFVASTLPTGIEVTTLKVTGTFRLLPNYPNPFNPETRIPFEVGNGTTQPVQLNIYNLLGQKIVTLVNKRLASGIYEVVWNGTNGRGEQVVSGVYFYELRVGDMHQIRKMVLVR